MKKLTNYVMFILLIMSSTCSSNKQVGSKGEPIFTAPIGIQAYSFRNYFPKDIPGTLDRIQAMGVKEIEGESGRIDPADYRRLCEDRGIKIPSTGAQFGELAKDPQKVADRAKVLGAKYVMCAWVPHENAGNFSKMDADRAIEVFNRSGKVLKENGITFCYHLHGYEFQPYQTGTLMDYIIQQTNPEYVSFEMDVFWVQFGGADPVALLEKYGSRWKMLHLKDMKKGIKKDLTGHANVEFNVPLGTGEIDMKGILIEAKKIGIAHYFIEDESSAVLDQVPKSIEYLKSLRYD